jgi:hypothetical protein
VGEREREAHAHAKRKKRVGDARAHTGTGTHRQARAPHGGREPHTAAQEDRHPLVRIHRHIDTHTAWPGTVPGTTHVQGCGRSGAGPSATTEKEHCDHLSLSFAQRQKDRERQEEAAL